MVGISHLAKARLPRLANLHLSTRVKMRLQQLGRWVGEVVDQPRFPSDIVWIGYALSEAGKCGLSMHEIKQLLFLGQALGYLRICEC